MAELIFSYEQQLQNLEAALLEQKKVVKILKDAANLQRLQSYDEIEEYDYALVDAEELVERLEDMIEDLKILVVPNPKLTIPGENPGA